MILTVARSACSIVWLVGRLGVFVLTLPAAHRRATRVFYRELRSSGLSRDEADALAEAYAKGTSLRSALRRRR